MSDRGPRRRRADRSVVQAQGFRDSFEDAWILALPAAAGLGGARSGGRRERAGRPASISDPDGRVSTREVERDEAIAAARTALDALGIGPGDPLLIHLGG